MFARCLSRRFVGGGTCQKIGRFPCIDTDDDEAGRESRLDFLPQPKAFGACRIGIGLEQAAEIRRQGDPVRGGRLGNALRPRYP